MKVEKTVTTEEKSGQNIVSLEERKKFEECVGVAIAKTSGGKDSEFGWLIYDQVKKSCYPNQDIVDALKLVTIEMTGISPKDQVEGMLAAQMIATHHAAMDCFKLAAKNFHIEVSNSILNTASRLMKAYTSQMEALTRYRGKGQQKMTVEHVHVNAGGKAIIGNVSKSVRGQNSSKGISKNNEQ